MQNGPHELQTLLDNLRELLEEGLKQETWSFTSKCYKNEKTEEVHQAKVKFLTSPDLDSAITLKKGLTTMQEMRKSFKFQQIDTLVDEIVSRTRVKIS